MRESNRYRCLKGLAVLLCFCLVGGCQQKTVEKSDKIVITVLYTNKFPQLEELVESTYSDIDLQCEITPYTSELSRRLENGYGPDLVLSKEAYTDDNSRYLIDISDLSASAAYDGTIMKGLRVEGKNYQLPLPGQYYGYIINETLFEQAGIELPNSNQSLIEALVQLKQQGYGLGDDDKNIAIQSDYNTYFGLFLIGGEVPDFLGTVEGVQWLSDYKEKNSRLTGVWDNVFDLTDELVASGVLDAAPLSKQRNSILTHERMASGNLAAVFGDSSLFAQCVSENQIAFEEGKAMQYSYRMLPLMSDEGNEPWILYAPSSYVGINASISEEKQEACKRILALISTQEGQDAIIKDLQMGASSLRGYVANETSVPNGVETFIDSGYVYNLNFPERVVQYLGSTAQQRMAGRLTNEELLQAVDQYYLEGSQAMADNLSVLTVMKQDLLFQNFNVRRTETELGNFLADCIASVAAAPIAVVNGGNIRSSLYIGDVYCEDLEALFPFENEVIVIEASGQTIWDMLENSVTYSDDEFPNGRFLQISGLHYVFDSSKPRGSRMVSVSLPDGTPIDLKANYQLAVNNYMAGAVGYFEGNGDGYTMLNIYDENTPKGDVTLIKESGMSYREMVKQYFRDHPEQEKIIELEGRIVDLANAD